jgi:hypothetical protein
MFHQQFKAIMLPISFAPSTKTAFQHVKQPLNTLPLFGAKETKEYYQIKKGKKWGVDYQHLTPNELKELQRKHPDWRFTKIVPAKTAMFKEGREKKPWGADDRSLIKKLFG